MRASPAAGRREQGVGLGIADSAQARCQLGIHGHAAEQTRGEWQLVARRELARERLFAERVMRHVVLGAVQDLLARQHLSRMAHEQQQELIFARRQVDAPAITKGFTGTSVQAKIAKLQRFRDLGLGAADGFS